MSYHTDSNNNKLFIKTQDMIRINYDGEVTSKKWAVTITSRRKYDNLYYFRAELYDFLKSIDYKYAVLGFMEYHKGCRVHMHGVLFHGNPPKFNSKNNFHFFIKPLNNQTDWDGYTLKDVWPTIQKEQDIKDGIFMHHKKPIILWDH